MGATAVGTPYGRAPVDEAIAAILGAAVGVAGTSLAATVAAASARWQVRKQATIEDARWRSRQRRDAYAGLLTSVKLAVGSLAAAGDALGCRRA